MTAIEAATPPIVKIAPKSTNPQLVRELKAPSRWVGSFSSYFGPPSGLAIHQMLMPIAAMSASHSFPEKATLCELYTARPRNVSHAIHRNARCHQVMRRSTVSSGFCRASRPSPVGLGACHCSLPVTRRS